LFILIIFSMMTLYPAVAEGDKARYRVGPKTNSGKKWRIGYLEGGPYKNYPINLRAIVYSLAELGWLVEPKIPSWEDADDSSRLWNWLAANVKSDYIEFVADAYWSANWETEIRKKNKEAMFKRVTHGGDIDLMLALGTWAGQDLAGCARCVPTVVISASNPFQAKIVKGIEYSGYAHIHARMDPTRYERQVRLFHDIIGFRKLGLAYENTGPGRTYAALADVEKVAKERGFEIVKCFTKDDIPDAKEADNSVIKCCRELAPKVDAVYLTLQRGVNTNNLPKILRILDKSRIPTFSQGGSEEVKYGVLLSIAQAGFRYVGRFHAETIAKIFNGAKPGDLSQVFEDPPKIAINLATAEVIGYDPPVDILSVADEIYQTVAEPAK
jgi:ABC-type uncharacterized transport system substrate-binding protein